MRVFHKRTQPIKQPVERSCVVGRKFRVAGSQSWRGKMIWYNPAGGRNWKYGTLKTEKDLDFFRILSILKLIQIDIR